MFPVLLCQRLRMSITRYASTFRQFLSRDATEARIERRDHLCHLTACLTEGRKKSLPGLRHGISSSLGGRCLIADSRKDRAKGADVRRDSPDAVQHLSLFVQKDQVAVTPHHFHHQSLLRRVSHFIQMFKGENKHALEARLFHGYQTAASDMLPEKHQKSRSRHGGLLRLFRDTGPCQTRIGGQQDPDRILFFFDGDLQLIPFRLLQFYHSSANSAATDLLRHRADCNTVECHLVIPPHRLMRSIRRCHPAMIPSIPGYKVLRRSLPNCPS